jgi:hypothetical protein
MKRGAVVLTDNKQEQHAGVSLPDETILHINSFVVCVGIHMPMNLLSWHSSCKMLHHMWNNMPYLAGMFEQARDKSLELFNKSKHGDYVVIYRNLSIIASMIPLINRVVERVIQPIDIRTISDITPRGFGYNEPLSYNSLFNGVCNKEEVLKLLDRYICLRYGWRVFSTMKSLIAANREMIIAVKPALLSLKDSNMVYDVDEGVRYGVGGIW